MANEIEIILTDDEINRVLLDRKEKQYNAAYNRAIHDAIAIVGGVESTDEKLTCLRSLLKEPTP